MENKVAQLYTVIFRNNLPMNNKEFTQLLADAKEHLNQLNKIVKDNTRAQELMLDAFFNPLLKRSSGGKKRVKVIQVKA